MRWPVAAIPLLAVLVAAVLPSCSGSQSRGSVPSDGTEWPQNYTSWKRLNEAPILLESEKTARNILVNQVVLSHRKDGSAAYPIGAVLVKEEMHLEADPQGRLRPGEVFRVSVMFKVGRGDTSGWAFKAFDPKTKREFPRDRVDPDGCYFCHADAKAGDYVFSRGD